MRDFNTKFSFLGRSSELKISKETSKLNYTIEELALTDISKIPHPTDRKYVFFSAAQGTFPKIDHIIGYKADIHKYKNIKRFPCFPLDTRGVKL